MRNLLRLERIITFILRIHPDYLWLQKENTARISFYQNTSSEEFGTGSLCNQSTDDQCVPGKLPFYNRVNQPDLVKWGKGNGVVITVSTNAINEAYNEVVYWRKNLFLIPYGKIGKDFIDKLTLLISAWNYETERQHVVLKAFFLLQLVYRNQDQNLKQRSTRNA